MVMFSVPVKLKNKPVGLAVLGEQCDPGRDGVGGAMDAQDATVQSDLAARQRIDTEQRARDLAAAGAEHSPEPKHLAALERRS